MEKYKKTVQNNKLKIIVPTWNYEFELLDGPYSVSRLCWMYHQKKTTLTTIFPVRVYINKINNRYKLELQLPEIMKMFGSTKKLIGKKNNGENVPRLDVVEVGLVKCNLVDNQY